MRIFDKGRGLIFILLTCFMYESHWWVVLLVPVPLARGGPGGIGTFEPGTVPAAAQHPGYPMMVPGGTTTNATGNVQFTTVHDGTGTRVC